jgi:hypothetical protein
MVASNRTELRLQSFAAFALYLTLAIVLFARGLFGHPDYVLGQGTDLPQTMWFFNWWRFSLSHGLNPFLTDWVWAPLGINLAWTTCVPLLSLISIPLQLTVGEPATYNILAMPMLPLAAFTAFVLCRRVTGAFWPSVLGGYIFGFSPYMLGQLLGHLVETAVFPLPLIALVALKRIDGEISAWRFAILLSLLLTIQFLLSVEHFATVSIICGFAFLLAVVFFDGQRRSRIIRLIAPTIVGYSIACVVLSPYLYYMLALGFPHGSIWSPIDYSSDLLNCFVPTATGFLGTFGFARAISGTFGGTLLENGAYIGIPLLIAIEIYRRGAWHTSAGRFLVAMLAIAIIASFGPALRVAGRTLFPMPWEIAGRLPLISIVLPVRFMLFAFLILALIVAILFAASTAHPLKKGLAAALILASIAPNPHASFWTSPLDLPAFFADRLYAKELAPRDIILPLPWGSRGNSMYWQLRSEMYFRMAGGWTGITPFAFTRMPVFNYFYGATNLPEAPDQLKAYIARFGVRAIIADPRDVYFPIWQATLASLGVPALNEKGVWIYKIPPASFTAYAGLSGAQLEARANALQFDTILEAAGAYLAGGHDLSKISAVELKRLDQLPRDWLDASDHQLWQVGPAPGGGVAIIIVGSYEGVSPLIQRYHAIASEIDYPAPTRWTPDSHPNLDQIKPLLMIFDASHLASAAQTLRSSPPPERTTPFVAGVSSGLGRLSP